METTSGVATTTSTTVSKVSLAAPNPLVIVLEPKGCLDRNNYLNFQKNLEQALSRTTGVVLVNLLWVDSITSEGMSALKAGIKLSAELGKTLSFQSVDFATRAILEQERRKDRENRAGPQREQFLPAFERFLSGQNQKPRAITFRFNQLAPSTSFRQTKNKPSQSSQLSFRTGVRVQLPA